MFLEFSLICSLSVEQGSCCREAAGEEGEPGAPEHHKNPVKGSWRLGPPNLPLGWMENILRLLSVSDGRRPAPANGFFLLISLQVSR